MVEDKKEIPKATAKIFAAVSAGMVLGVPMTSYFGGNFSFKMAMLFFVFLNTLSFIATLFLFLILKSKFCKNKQTIAYFKIPTFMD